MVPRRKGPLCVKSQLVAETLSSVQSLTLFSPTEAKVVSLTAQRVSLSAGAQWGDQRCRWGCLLGLNPPCGCVFAG